VTYADDLVILCRRGKAEEALSRLREIMGKLKLTVNLQGAGRRVRLPGLSRQLIADIAVLVDGIAAATTRSRVFQLTSVLPYVIALDAVNTPH
jgi:hypothetical protein